MWCGDNFLVTKENLIQFNNEKKEGGSNVAHYFLPLINTDSFYDTLIALPLPAILVEILTSPLL